MKLFGFANRATKNGIKKLRGIKKMTPQEAIRKAESIVAKTHQTFSTAEAREIMAGLLAALDEKALEKPK